MTINEVTNRMFKLTQSYRDGNITTSQLQNRVEKDVQGYLNLFNSKLIDQATYESMLAVVYDFETIIDEISHNKFITKSN